MKAGHVAAVLLALLVAACATTQSERVAVMQRIDQLWLAENQVTRAASGVRMVRGTPAQTHRAARAAMERLGLVVDPAGSAPPAVTASRLFAGGGWSWSPEVRAAEEPRLRKAAADVLGSRAGQLVLKPGDEILRGRAVLGPSSKGLTRLNVDFNADAPGIDCRSGACIMEMPPAALRAAYYEFWTAFDEELTEIRDEDAARAATARRRTPARPARARPAAKPPSDWVLPPSGWKPPPR